MYSSASAILLSYAKKAIDDLRIFYTTHVEHKIMRGSFVLPMEGQRDKFVVKTPVGMAHAHHHVRYDFVVVGTEIKVSRDGQPVDNLTFSTAEKDTKESESSLHKFLESIGRSRVDAHMVCEAVKKGQTVCGVMGNK